MFLCTGLAVIWKKKPVKWLMKKCQNNAKAFKIYIKEGK